MQGRTDSIGSRVVGARNHGVGMAGFNHQGSEIVGNQNQFGRFFGSEAFFFAEVVEQVGIFLQPRRFCRVNQFNIVQAPAFGCKICLNCFDIAENNQFGNLIIGAVMSGFQNAVIFALGKDNGFVKLFRFGNNALNVFAL